jgi:hypothetical protein
MRLKARNESPSGVLEKTSESVRRCSAGQQTQARRLTESPENSCTMATELIAHAGLLADFKVSQQPGHFRRFQDNSIVRGRLLLSGQSNLNLRDKAKRIWWIIVGHLGRQQPAGWRLMREMIADISLSREYSNLKHSSVPLSTVSDFASYLNSNLKQFAL